MLGVKGAHFVGGLAAAARGKCSCTVRPVSWPSVICGGSEGMALLKYQLTFDMGGRRDVGTNKYLQSDLKKMQLYIK